VLHMNVARWQARVAWMLWEDRSNEDLYSQPIVLVLSSSDRMHG
jgi:hypothetical protein